VVNNPIPMMRYNECSHNPSSEKSIALVHESTLVKLSFAMYALLFNKNANIVFENNTHNFFLCLEQIV